MILKKKKKVPMNSLVGPGVSEHGQGLPGTFHTIWPPFSAGAVTAPLTAL